MSISLFICKPFFGNRRGNDIFGLFDRQKTRKILTEKIAQLNSAIDDVSNQLHAEDEGPNGVAVNSDEVEASV